MVRYKLLFCFIVCCSLFQVQGKELRQGLKNLQCEYLTNPIGIDAANPRFTWQLRNGMQGALQTACRVVVSTDSSDVASGKGKVWDSGEMSSDNCLAVYKGEALKPFTRYFWSVSVWGNDKRTVDTSPVAWFETGMMGVENWKGEWITDTRDIRLKPAPMFRKEWNITKPVASARIYIAAAGLSELFLNGERIGNHRLDPMYTRFDRRTLYVTHDVTSRLKEGKNAIGVLLGNGWYNHQSTAVWYFDEAPWRDRPRFCLDLRILYADGTTEVLSSGRDWKTSLSQVVFNSIYTGEHIDGRLEKPGWDRSGFDDRKWANAIPVGAPAPLIVAQSLHPIRDVVRIAALSMKKLGPDHYLFDFGRNISGVTELKVKGEAGTVIRLVHAERLNREGHADLSNIIVHYRPKDDTDPFQTDIVYLSGKGEETFRPSFNYKGFRYTEVFADKPVELTAKSLTAIFMHSDVPPAGLISSSNETLNKIWEATNNSYLSNLFGYPTDCPQREKNGWTGDSHIAIEMGLYNFDAITVYEKWLADFRDEQQPNGVLPAIIPTSGWGYTWANGPDWTSAIAIIPWNVYLFYGDIRLLEICYDNIRRYVDRITEESRNGLTSWGLGDWVPVKSVTPKEFTSSIYYFVDATILAKTAQLLNRPSDAEKYMKLAETVQRAINKKYLNEATGIYGSGLQTELSAALYWGIVPDQLRQKVAANLAERVEKDGKHIDVGLLGTKTILNALSENGYANLACEVALQETYPSWGWWIKNGATTLYENWKIDAGSDISLNHIMFGEISAWFYKGLGGIFPDPEQPGFRHVILRPGIVPQLASFEARHLGPYGEIVSGWKRNGKQTDYHVTIPPGSTATLSLPAVKFTVNGVPAEKSKYITITDQSPAGSTLRILSGEYTFSY